MSSSNIDTDQKPLDPYKEQNLDQASLEEKVEGLSEFITACKFGMMTTHHGSSGALVSRCMALAAKESGGIDLIFHTNTESGKTDDIESDKHVNVSFLNSSGEWASISGNASVVTDRSAVKKYYSPAIKVWLGDLGDGTHDGGPDDPRVGVIRVQTKSATYAISKNILNRASELAHSAVTGNVPAVNKLRQLSEQEIITWRSR